MEVIQGLENLKKDFRKLILALGSFDGMHLGHEKVIGKVVKRAGEIKGTSMVLTFHPHPRRVIKAGDYPPLLTTTREKLKLIGRLEVDVCLIINFDEIFSQMPPREFAARVLHQHLNVKEIFVGSDYLFGKGRTGDIDFLIRMGDKYNFRVNKIRAVRRKGEAISSTRIRQLIQRGELSRARELLGRPYSISGEVRGGDKKAGLIGYPTANFVPYEEVIPPEGAYAAWIRLDNSIHPGVVGITEKNKEMIVEAHLFNFHGDLYGANIEVIFWKMLREKKYFSHEEKAKKQIAKDKEMAQKLMSL